MGRQLSPETVEEQQKPLTEVVGLQYGVYVGASDEKGRISIGPLFPAVKSSAAKQPLSLYQFPCSEIFPGLLVGLLTYPETQEQGNDVTDNQGRVGLRMKGLREGKEAKKSDCFYFPHSGLLFVFPKDGPVDANAVAGGSYNSLRELLLSFDDQKRARLLQVIDALQKRKEDYVERQRQLLLDSADLLAEENIKLLLNQYRLRIAKLASSTEKEDEEEYVKEVVQVFMSFNDVYEIYHHLFKEKDWSRELMILATLVAQVSERPLFLRFIQDLQEKVREWRKDTLQKES